MNECSMEHQILTPVEYKDGIFLKRDDYFTVYNVCGGKARNKKGEYYGL